MKKSMTFITSCTNNNYFGFLITFFFKLKTAVPKKNMFFLLCSFLPLPYLFHPSYLPSIFIQYFSPFLSLPLSLTFFLLLFSLSSFPHLNLTIIFLSLVLSSQVLWNFLCHTLLILPVVPLFFHSLPSFFLVPFTQLYILPSSFCSQSFHIFTGIPVPLVVILSFLLLLVLFLLSIPSPIPPSLCQSLSNMFLTPSLPLLVAS
jgi:hypothetical protein